MNDHIEARFIVFNDVAEMLLIEQVPDGWVPPGGGSEAGETPTQATIREVREESEIDIEIIKLLWCTETYNPEPDQLNLGYMFLGRVFGGELGSDERRAGFFPRSEFESLGAYKHIDWPDSIFWQLLKTEPIWPIMTRWGPRLLHEFR